MLGFTESSELQSHRVEAVGGESPHTETSRDTQSQLWLLQACQTQFQRGAHLSFCLLHLPTFVHGLQRPSPMPTLSRPHLVFPGSSGVPSFRQVTRGGGAPSALHGSRTVWFTELFTVGDPGSMMGAAGEEYREQGWVPVTPREHRQSRVGQATLTVDVHVEDHTGAARRVAGCAAVVAAIGHGQSQQLEEPALLGELGVGVRLQGPHPG